MPKFEIGGHQEWRSQKPQKNNPPAKRNWKKIIQVSAVIFLIMVMIAGINAWFTRTTWDEYHLNPEDSLTEQFDYVEVYPSMAREMGPLNPKTNWGHYGNLDRGGYDSYLAETSCVNTIEVNSFATENKDDQFESVLWYGMEYRDNEWVVTASTYKPFKDGEMRLLECQTKDGMTQRIKEIDKK